MTKCQRSRCFVNRTRELRREQNKRQEEEKEALQRVKLATYYLKVKNACHCKRSSIDLNMFSQYSYHPRHENLIK